MEPIGNSDSDILYLTRKILIHDCIIAQGSLAKFSGYFDDCISETPLSDWLEDKTPKPRMNENNLDSF